MPDDDWQLAQGTVDFRNEERRAAAGRGEWPGVPPPVEEAGGNLPPSASEPPALCPNCLIELDLDGYCSGCSYLATVKRPA